MRQSLDHFGETLDETRQSPATRRGLLRGGAAVAGGAALAMSIPALRDFRAMAQDVGEDEISVLNYALTLEHLENAFYRDGLNSFALEAFTGIGFDESFVAFLGEIGAHEAAHVETLTAVITELGGTPVAEGTYDFGDAFTDPEAFLATAAALENTGVGAYTGAAQYLIDADDLLTAALTIHGVEARHAAYLNLAVGENPFPESFDAPLNPDEVIEIAGPFVGEGTEVVLPAAFEGGTPEADEEDGTPDA